MTKRTKSLDKFSASPVGDKCEFASLFAVAKAKYPGVALGYIGTDGINHFFQESGKPTEYSVPVSKGWKPYA